MEADMESLGFGIIPVWCKVCMEEKEETIPPGQAQNRCDKQTAAWSLEAGQAVTRAGCFLSDRDGLCQLVTKR